MAIEMTRALAVAALAGCGTTPSTVVADAAGDGATDAFTDLGPTGCAACEGAVAFTLNETAEPLRSISGTEVAVLNENGGTVLLGQAGPPGFGASACFSSASFLQFPGAPFTTLGPHHTLEIMIQPLQDGLAVEWSNAGLTGWGALFTNQTLLARFCAGDCPTAVSIPQGDPRWVAAQWYHAALVRDGDRARAYLGGRITGEVTGLSDADVEVPLGLAVGDPVLGAQNCIAWVRLTPCACYSGTAIAPPASESE
jgi:hypothetical protein